MCSSDLFAGPFFHPVHGDAAEEGFLGAFVERGGFGMGRDEIIFFALEEGVETGAIDGGVARSTGLGHGWLRSGCPGGAGAVENIAKAVGNPMAGLAFSRPLRAGLTYAAPSGAGFVRGDGTICDFVRSDPTTYLSG